MKKLITLVLLAFITFACNKDEKSIVSLNDNSVYSIKPIDGNWILSHTINKDYHYLKVNNLLSSQADTLINKQVSISQSIWDNERINITWNDKEMQVNFLDTNKRYLIEQYFDQRMIVSENDTLTHFYFR